MSYVQINCSVGPEGTLRFNCYGLLPPDPNGSAERASILTYLVLGQTEEQAMLKALFPAWEDFQAAVPLLADVATAELAAGDARAAAFAALHDFCNCVRARSAVHKLGRNDNGNAQ